MSYENEKREIKVLMVCYDPASVSIEECLLGGQGGLRVVTASSNNEALDTIEKTKPDVIVGDSPGFSVNGRAKIFELVKTLRSKNNQTPFIVFAYDDEKIPFQEICGLGTIRFVTKSVNAPISYSILKNQIISIASHMDKASK